jgi:hypothetical protein
VSSIINQSKCIVKVSRRADLTREFPHAKEVEARAYKRLLLAEHIERGCKAVLGRGFGLFSV